ncbi:MAG: hypothetical protein Q4F72_12625 [Desulfovibrionaceae bacterium]|nr:hypothetical protein [Desulfovibrionaceae bacterium]
MIEVYREEGLCCLSLAPAGANEADSDAPQSREAFDTAIDLVSLYLQARSESGWPTFACEAFWPGEGGAAGSLPLDREADSPSVTWKFSFPKKPDAAALAVLLSLSGSLPSLDEMRSPDVWLGGCYRLIMDGSWGRALEECGLDGATVTAALDLWTRAGVGMVVEDQSLDLPVIDLFTQGADGSLVCDVNPLALYALLGLDAQYCLEDAADLLEEDFAWTPGLLPLLCALGEELPVEDEGDEVADEIPLARLAALAGGPCEGPAAAGVAEFDGLMELVGRLPGWQVRPFEEIADQDEGGEAVRRGERVYRVTHSGM